MQIRKSIKHSKQSQSRQDYSDEIDHLEGLCAIEAIGDIVSFKKVFLLDDVPKQRCNASSTTIQLLKTSFIQQQFSALPPRIVQKKKTEIRNFAKTEVDEDSKLVRALAFARESREVVDPPRLWFEAAVLFDELEMFDRALEAFIKSVRFCDPNAIVDAYDLPITPEYLRKVRVMSKFQEEALKKKREELRGGYLLVEDERQRLRNILGHCHAARLFLKFERYDEAHASMREAFSRCKEGPELDEIFRYYHSLFMDFWDMSKTQLSGNQKLLRDTGGPLAEAHIHILTKLLEQEPNNIDFMLLLGHRYSQCFNFALASRYYTKARLAKLHESGSLDILNLDGPDPEGAAIVVESRRRIAGHALEIKQQQQNVSKAVANSYSVDMSVDEERFNNRTDFCGFNGPHKGSITVLYTAPNLGWESDAIAQHDKFAGTVPTTTSKLPKIKSRRIK